MALRRNIDSSRECLRRTLTAVGQDRPLEAWVVGSALDAVAMAVACRYELRQPGRSRSAWQIVLSPYPRTAGPMRLPPSVAAHLGCTPDSVGLEHTEGGWRPKPELLEEISLLAPPGPVDVVLVGHGAPFDLAVHAIRRLRPGGYLITSDPALRPAVGFDQLDATGRHYVKTSTATDHHSRPVRQDASVGELRAENLAQFEYRAALVTTYSNLARALARRFTSSAGREDLEQVAMTALVRVAARYRPDHAARYRPDHAANFASFATVSILGELKRHMRDKTWGVRVPRSLQERHLAVRAASDELTQHLGASPTIEQIASYLNVTEDDVLEAMDAGQNYASVSLDAPLRDTDLGPIFTELAQEDTGFELNLALRDLREALSTLEGIERRIIEGVFFAGRTQRDLATEMGVSQMQISRLAAKTLAKLRTAIAGPDYICVA